MNKNCSNPSDSDCQNLAALFGWDWWELCYRSVMVGCFVLLWSLCITMWIYICNSHTSGKHLQDARQPCSPGVGWCWCCVMGPQHGRDHHETWDLLVTSLPPTSHPARALPGIYFHRTAMITGNISQPGAATLEYRCQHDCIHIVMLYLHIHRPAQANAYADNAMTSWYILNF